MPRSVLLLYIQTSICSKWRGGDHEAETVLSGDLDNVLETATAKSQVTERLLAHAAGVSLLWQRVAASWWGQVEQRELSTYLVSSKQLGVGGSTSSGQVMTASWQLPSGKGDRRLGSSVSGNTVFWLVNMLFTLIGQYSLYSGKWWQSGGQVFVVSGIGEWGWGCWVSGQDGRQGQHQTGSSGQHLPWQEDGVQQTVTGGVLSEWWHQTGQDSAPGAYWVCHCGGEQAATSRVTSWWGRGVAGGWVPGVQQLGVEGGKSSGQVKTLLCQWHSLG